MDELDQWLYFDGPAPEPVTILLDALCEVPPATPEDTARMSRAFFERLGAPAARAPSTLAGTALALEVPAGLFAEKAALPFVPPEQVPPQKRSVRTLQVPVRRVGLGETAPVGDDAMERALAALPWPRSRAAEPGPAPAAAIPAWTLQQYASLCTELAAWPDQGAVILARYQVSSTEAHGALQRHWQERLAVSAETRAAFEEACEAYVAWLRSLPG